jgi:hypothetical protein
VFAGLLFNAMEENSISQYFAQLSHFNSKFANSRFNFEYILPDGKVCKFGQARKAKTSNDKGFQNDHNQQQATRS